MLSEITITVKGGAGGDGAVSFRRERYVPRGGPDGGDGGPGGSVIIQAEEALSGFEELRGRRDIHAGPGGGGAGRRKHGRAGDDVVVRMPVGTTIWRDDGGEWEELGDLLRAKAEVVVAKGGEGGKGNARFATSTNQAPRLAEMGLPGEQARLKLEIRILADVGLVGLPNAGKSSLLGALTAAKPVIAEYPFTTIEAQIGTVSVGYERFVLADIPGLIEGAGEGKGLGIEFLQQIERTSVLLFVVDGTRPAPLEDLASLAREIEVYGRRVAEKAQVVALNKIDLLSRGRLDELLKLLRGAGFSAYATSAKTGEGSDEVARSVLAIVREQTARVPDNKAARIITPKDKDLQIEKTGGGFTVRGSGAEGAAAKLGAGSVEARRELWRRLGRMGVTAALRRAGAKPGGRVYIGTIDLELPE